MATFTEEQIKATAALICALFTWHKHTLNQFWFGDLPRYASAWRMAARTCLENGIDPRDFIAAQFDAIINPYVSVLQNPHNSLRRYRDYMNPPPDGNRDDLIVSLNMDKIRSLSNRGVDMREFLAHPDEAISTPVLYLVAVALGQYDIAEKWRPFAEDLVYHCPRLGLVLAASFPNIPEAQALAAPQRTRSTT
jgi:hypothetical protein